MQIKPPLKKSLFFILGLFLSTYPIFAQEATIVSLDEVKSRARENNTDLKLSQRDYAIAKADYERTRAVLF